MATVSIGGARNAGLLAVRMLAAGQDTEAARLRDRLVQFAAELRDTARSKGSRLRDSLSGRPGYHEPGATTDPS